MNFDWTIVVPDCTVNSVEEKGIGIVFFTDVEQVSITTPSAHWDDILIWSTEFTYGGVNIEDISMVNCVPAEIPDVENVETTIRATLTGVCKIA